MGKARYCTQCGTYLQRRDSVFCGDLCYRQSLAATDSDSSDGLEITRPFGQSRRKPRLLKHGDGRIPRPPNPSRIKSRSAYQVSFGDYKGKPNFLVWSKKGLAWANIPSALQRICNEDDMRYKILDFSLGTGGRYYLVWKDGNEARMETSPGLWEYLNVDFEGGSIRKLQFGAEGTVWGIRSFRKYKTRARGSKSKEKNSSRDSMVEVTSGSGTYVVREEPFGQIPDSLMRKISEIYPSMEYSNLVDFVTVGKGGSWVMGAMQGLCFWDRIEGKLLRKVLKLYNKGGGLKNVVIAPTTDSLYVIETQDGTVHYRVFDEWDAMIRRHLQPRDTPPRESGVSRTLHPPRTRSSQPEPLPSSMQRSKSQSEGTRSGGHSRGGSRLDSQRTSYARASRGSRVSSGGCGHYPACHCHEEQGGGTGEAVVAAMVAGSTLVSAGVQVAAMTGCSIM